jgi:hypothetical protein
MPIGERLDVVRGDDLRIEVDSEKPVRGTILATLHGSLGRRVIEIRNRAFRDPRATTRARLRGSSVSARGLPAGLFEIVLVDPDGVDVLLDVVDLREDEEFDAGLLSLPQSSD